jgi:hypothetical protein
LNLTINPKKIKIMRPPFKFVYVLAAAAVTYGALAAFRVPRFDGPHRGWVYGHDHGFGRNGGCGNGCNRYEDRDAHTGHADSHGHETPAPAPAEE